MPLLDAFLQDAGTSGVWIAARTDGLSGAGSARDPYNGAPRRSASISVFLTRGSAPSATTREAIASTGSTAHGLQDGDMVEIAGVTGGDANIWNGTFGIYDVTQFSFRYLMKEEPDPLLPGKPTATRLTFPFDEVMRAVPPNTRIHLGPGTYQTRGFGTDAAGAIDERGWQPKTGQKITGAGVGATTLQLVGADKADYHYHTVGMPIIPTGTTAIPPLEHFEISDLTIDCNVDNQPGRPAPGYAPVACGAVRILGAQSCIRGVKAINWGTKSFKEGGFVFSVIVASGRPTGADGHPLVTGTAHSGIEDCIAVQPSKNSARETTVLHLGGLKNSTNHAQGFGQSGFIRRNFVDCGYLTTETVPKLFSSLFVTSKSGTQIVGLGKFIGKRSHFRTSADVGTYVRFYNPKDAASKWNGYFPIAFRDSDDTIRVDLTSAQGSSNNSDFVIMGTEFRGIAVTSAVGAVVEGNQIHNCWIGGPYASPLDDSVSQPTVPPTLAREERLDALNALNIRSLIVRNNFYRNVAAGPYWNMGGVSSPVFSNEIQYDYASGVVTVTPMTRHHLWPGARVKIESAPDPAYEGFHEVVTSADSAFTYQLAPGLPLPEDGAASYRVVSGIDFLTIDGNTISLADLDETEFGIKVYPLGTGTTAQTYRAFGIVIGDNELSAAGGPYAHRQVFIRNNKIRYVDGQRAAAGAGLGPPGGAAMQLTGIKELHVTRNVVDLNASKKLLAFRCGMVRLFHNTLPGGEFVTGWPSFVATLLDDPVSVAEDAFILSLLGKKR